MMFFGEPWDAPVVDDGRHVPAPVGQACLSCQVAIVDGDQGLIMWAVREVDGQPAGAWEPQHRACLLRAILGSVEHQAGTCSCRSR